MRRYWETRGAFWDRWADVVAEWAARVNEPLIAAARLAPGMRVLDLASGTGQPALSIAERLGPRGEVVATDLVSKMLAGAKRRAAASGRSNIRFGLADMAALPFRARCFDRITCRFGIMFVPAVAAALAEVRRVLVPGGRAAFMQAGFRDVEEEEVRLDGSAPIGQPFWRPQLEMSLGPQIGRADPAQQRALEAAIAEAFAREIQGDRYVLTAHVRIVTGDAPSG